ncbi:hypothetical protein OF83DRAFT_1155387, partial [Amylostereum chailletii]
MHPARSRRLECGSASSPIVSPYPLTVCQRRRCSPSSPKSNLAQQTPSGEGGGETGFLPSRSQIIARSTTRTSHQATYIRAVASLRRRRRRDRLDLSGPQVRARTGRHRAIFATSAYLDVDMQVRALEPRRADPLPSVKRTTRTSLPAHHRTVTSFSLSFALIGRLRPDLSAP